MNAKDLYPIAIPSLEFMPYGEEAEFFAVRGWVPDFMLLDGALACTVELDGWGSAADVIECSTNEIIQPWYDDDQDKPDEIYHAEIRTAWHNAFKPTVSYGIGRFWVTEHEKHPDNPYPPDGGLELQNSYGGELRFRSDDGDQPEGRPDVVPVTYMRIDL